MKIKLITLMKFKSELFYRKVGTKLNMIYVINAKKSGMNLKRNPDF